MSWAKKLIYGILVLGSLLPISFGLYGGTNRISLAEIGFFLWALAPYVGFGLLTYWTKNTRVLLALIVLASILVAGQPTSGLILLSCISTHRIRLRSLYLSPYINLVL